MFIFNPNVSIFLSTFVTVTLFKVSCCKRVTDEDDDDDSGSLTPQQPIMICHVFVYINAIFDPMPVKN